MPVLTFEEYENKKNSKLKESEEVKQETKKETENEEQKKEQSILKNQKSWVLMFPENGTCNKANFISELNFEGRKKKYECMNGIVRTRDNEIASFLIRKGYLEL